VALLKQIKGSGHADRADVLLTLDRSASLPQEPRCGRYLGLQPGRRTLVRASRSCTSAGKVDPYLRTLLVQGAQHILGPFGVDCDLPALGPEAG